MAAPNDRGPARFLGKEVGVSSLPGPGLSTPAAPPPAPPPGGGPCYGWPMDAHIRELCTLWHLEPTGPARETPSSRIQRVLADGQSALLKCLRPDSDEHAASAIMTWFDGRGSARVLRRTECAQLLEWIDGPPLSSLVAAGRDAEAAGILAEVVGALHAPRPGLPDGLQPLEDRFAPLLQRVDSGDEVQRQAAALAARLLETTEAVQPLHGDIHHDNILRHATRGWLAIDAKGLLGDCHYDLANALCNPLQYPDIVCDPARVLSQARIYAGHLSLDLDRLLAFGLCQACLAEAWCAEDGDDPTHWRRMAEIFAVIVWRG